MAGLERFNFGDSPELADELAGLVLAGRKTATCWAASDGMLTEVDKRMVMCDGAGNALAIVQTIEVTEQRFDTVDAAFAYDEGEDDRTLEAWRLAHQRYFTRLGTFAPDMRLYCERFRVVVRLDPPVPSAAPRDPGPPDSGPPNAACL